MPCERITSSTTARIPKLTTLEMSNDLESMKITCETGTQGSGPSSPRRLPPLRNGARLLPKGSQMKIVKSCCPLWWR